MTNFEFVVSSGTRERPSSAVRSHAVKSGLQRKGKPETVTGSRDSQLTIRQKDSLKGRFRLTEPSSKSKNSKTTAKKSVEEPPPTEDTSQLLKSTTDSGPSNENLSAIDFFDDLPIPEMNDGGQSVLCASWEIVRSPSQGRGDPFNTFTVPQTGEVDKLMKFFISRFDLQVAMAHVQKQWWGYAISDPLVMHTTLGLSAATWSMFIKRPAKVIEEGNKQKWLAIRGIRERIGQHENNIALIGAIANLANMEGIEGDFNIARVHLRGLELLIKSRGGFFSFKDNINVVRAVTWSDLQAAAGLGQKPLFPLILPLNSINIPASVLAEAEKPALSHLRVFESSPADTAIRFNFALLRQAHYALKSKAVSPDELRILINGVDHHLSLTLGKEDLSDRARLILTGAQTFLYVIIRETRAMCLIPRLITRRAREQLRTCLARLSAHQDYWHGLLWCITIGAASSWESGEDWEFYSSTLSNALQMMNVVEPMGLEVILRRFLWDQKYPGKFIDTYGPNLFFETLECPE